MVSTTRLPVPVQESYEWQYRGACRSVDPDTFFAPEVDRAPHQRRREAAAKERCAICPVINECLAHALTVREPFGVWGGLNTSERRQLLTQRQAG